MKQMKLISKIIDKKNWNEAITNEKWPKFSAPIQTRILSIFNIYVNVPITNVKLSIIHELKDHQYNRNS